jgi:pimeloyl-ACP methyl ester carboxylesterase
MFGNHHRKVPKQARLLRAASAWLLSAALIFALSPVFAPAALAEGGGGAPAGSGKTIVVIPGIAGSKLMAGGTTVWPDALTSADSPLTPPELQAALQMLSLDETGNPPVGSPIQAEAPTNKNSDTGYGALNTYTPLVTALKKEFGGGNVHFFSYDWRLDNSVNAERLKNYIDKLGVSEVSIVAHSMGGLIASKYIANGNADKIDKYISLATPYLGSPKVPYVFATGDLLSIPHPFLLQGLKALSSHMLSAYQLLPETEGPHLYQKKGDSYIPVFNPKSYIQDSMQLTNTAGSVSSETKGPLPDNAFTFKQSLYSGDSHAIDKIDKVDRCIITGGGRSTINAAAFDESGEYVEKLQFKRGDGTVPSRSADMDGKLTPLYTSPFPHTSIVQDPNAIGMVIAAINGSTVPATPAAPVAPAANGNGYTVVTVEGAASAVLSTSAAINVLSFDNTNPFGVNVTSAAYGDLYHIGRGGTTKVFAVNAGAYAMRVTPAAVGLRITAEDATHSLWVSPSVTTRYTLIGVSDKHFPFPIDASGEVIVTGSGGGGSGGSGGPAAPNPDKEADKRGDASASESAPAAGTNPFADLKESDWFFDDVRYVRENGLFRGTGATAFSPNAPMTRAMLATVLHRLAGEPAATGGAAFGDVPAGKWFSDAVAWASANGVINGYGANVFGTNDNVTREQIAVMLYRYAKQMGPDVSKAADLSAYADAGEISEWAREALAWANAAGLIAGRSADELAPADNATRAEVAAILHRFIEAAK